MSRIGPIQLCFPKSWSGVADGSRDSGCSSMTAAEAARVAHLWKTSSTDVSAVRREAEQGGFRPDILLERGDKPPIWLEFTHTSPPSAAKLAYCTAHGIDIFELDGSQRPVDSSVIRGHISNRNCRNHRRQRLADLWQHLATLDDPIVGIREDFRSPYRQRKEREALCKEFEQQRRDVAGGKLRCVRCDRPFAGTGDGYSVSYIYTHRPDGDCGQVPFCDDCLSAVWQVREDEVTEDASSWSLNEDCAACQIVLSKHLPKVDELQQRKGVWMPEPYGRRLVQEPERRVQQYVVGNRTVSRRDLQSVLMMFKYVLVKVLPADPRSRSMLRELNRINRAIQYANNIVDWDWLDGIGESYVPEYETPDDAEGDKYLYPRRWWPDLPPCPLTII